MKGEAAAPLRRLDRAFLAAAPAHWIALSGGAGLVPKAPGTVGALVGLPLGFGLAAAGPLAALALVVLFGLIGIWACGATARAAGVHDHQAIVFDETWAMAAVVAFGPPGLVAAVAGFAAFRLFDIAKPWPIGWADDHVEGGLGIMLDDGLAALYALAGLHVLARFGWLA
ncbi:phosphatidylglycerophosphatase A family protein [Phreatobacter sp. AB_2022a]|uniref:phosphatidylglycerophosphatase A family protein n=1 Tax=Phreatobacter sp. AB_2022a TaxID=3003134 RepID=UPI0022874A03|nr:phosphatidylglycerophosphatase A [Phreatobacter sp. AB_2022a]MCZ0732946.1 phosphatidylglycerophosphatase A [Phreatobacter sp. AB_2022a]